MQTKDEYTTQRKSNPSLMSFYVTSIIIMIIWCKSYLTYAQSASGTAHNTMQTMDVLVVQVVNKTIF